MGYTEDQKDEAGRIYTKYHKLSMVGDAYDPESYMYRVDTVRCNVQTTHDENDFDGFWLEFKSQYSCIYEEDF